MILYFSSTGNSEALALLLGEMLNDRVINIVDLADDCIKEINSESTLGLVFPVYGWSIPMICRRFLEKLKNASINAKYIFTAMTCGDDVGMVDKHLRKALAKNGLKLNGCFSVNMPNTYVCLPGFDVDNDSKRQEKLGKFYERVKQIAGYVNEQKEMVDVKRGALPYTKTYVLGGFFRRFLVTDKPFRTSPECNKCGTCVKICPNHNICISDGLVKWNGNCTGCLACYHHCLNKSIRFGKQTDKKGQYLLKKYRKEIK